jgi:hypothetical protein
MSCTQTGANVPAARAAHTVSMPSADCVAGERPFLQQHTAGSQSDATHHHTRHTTPHTQTQTHRHTRSTQGRLLTPQTRNSTRRPGDAFVVLLFVHRNWTCLCAQAADVWPAAVRGNGGGAAPTAAWIGHAHVFGLSWNG